MAHTGKTISVDHPGHVDQLGRVLFARHLFSVITNVEAEPSGAVVGLEGPWGSGKTRVLRSLEAIAHEQPEAERIVLVHFNPWMVSGTHGLVEALLLQIAAEIPQPKPRRRRMFSLKRSDVSDAAKISGSIIQYTRVLSAVKHFAPIANLLWPGSGIAIAALGEATSEATAVAEQLKEPLAKLMQTPNSLSLNATKRNVELALRSFGRRIVVVVDDIDRLAPIELASMVQAIKAVADFPNVIYLVSYDQDIAAQALKSSLQIADGRAFLEKIIQIPVQLPPPPARKFQQFAVSRVRSVLSEEDLEASERADLSKAWPIVAALLHAPRDIERLRTRLQVVLPLLIGHVNAADLVILEALSLTAPDVVRWIDAHPKSLMMPGLRGLDTSLNAIGALGDQWAHLWADGSEKDKNSTDRPIELEKLVTQQQSRELVPIREAVNFIFDKARGWDRTHAHRTGSMRVQEFRFWYRWRCLHDSQERWATSEIEALLRQPETIRSTGLLLNETDFIEFCKEVCDLGIQNISSANAKEFSALFMEAERLYRLASRYAEHEAFGYGPIGALETVLRIDSPQNRQAAIESIIDSGSIWLAGSVVYDAWRDTQHRPAGATPGLAPDESAFKLFLDRFLRRVGREFARTETFAAEDGYGPNTLLNWLGDLGAKSDQLCALAKSFVGGDSKRLQTFFSAERDSPRWEAFPMKIDWIRPPEVQEYLGLMDATPALFADFSMLRQTLERFKKNWEASSGSL